MLRVRSVRESISMSVSQSASASVSVSASMPAFMMQRNRQSLVPLASISASLPSSIVSSFVCVFAPVLSDRACIYECILCHFVPANLGYCLQQQLSVLQHDSIIYGFIYAYT